MHSASDRRSNRPQWLDLHPAVYRLLIGSVVWLFVALWLCFGHDAYTALQLGIVAAFLAVFTGVPAVMARLAKRKSQSGQVTFAEWRGGDLDTYTGPVAAGEAALMVVIGPVACVLGLTVISAMAYMTAAGIF